jgi:Icc-related predicted phosphoesterase
VAVGITIVAMADTHMFHGDLGPIPDGDVLVHAGDMGRAGDEEELREVAAWLRALPHREKVIVPGNHDFLFETEPQKARALFAGMHVLIDEPATIRGLRFWGSPWTPVFHDWAFMLPPGAALAARWALIPDALDVLVTHGPPRGILDDANGYRPDGQLGGLAEQLDGQLDAPLNGPLNGQLDGELQEGGGGAGQPYVPVPAGCADLLERVRQVRPRLHLYGHIHYNQGQLVLDGTRFGNCTTNEGEAAPLVVTLG